MWNINIIGEGVSEVTDVQNGYSYLPTISIGDREYYICEDREAAVDATADYWYDMVNNDPKEFACLVGEETLIQWGMGQSAGPGTLQANNIDEWIEGVSEYPEEQWASYDGYEKTGTISKSLQEELGFDSKNVYLYRWN